MVLQAGGPGWRREIPKDSWRQAIMPLFLTLPSIKSFGCSHYSLKWHFSRPVLRVILRMLHDFDGINEKWRTLLCAIRSVCGS
jgi:hypothetical protein